MCLIMLAMLNKNVLSLADPLELDDGKELIEMVCTSYESPDDAAEDDQHDFSKHWLRLSKSILLQI